MEKNKNSQRTFIKNKHSIEVLEKILFVTHIIAFVFGLLSLIEIAIDHKAKMWIEIITLILIFIIVSLQIFVKVFDRTFIRSELSKIWGTKNIISNDNFSGEKISIGFKSKRNIFNHNIDFEIINKDGKSSKWNPIVLIIDPSNSSLFIEVESEKNSNQHCYVEIDYKKRKASWSGKLPVDSSYGSWTWKEK